MLISHLWGKPSGLWVMDGKEGSLCTNGNSFLSLHNYHVCNGKPPDKAVTFLMPKNTTNQENSSLLSFHVDVKFWSYGIVTLALKHKILCSWFLSHNSYTDFIYHVIEILTSCLWNTKSFWKPPWSSEIIWTNITLRNKGRRFRCLSLKWHKVKTL